MTMYGINYVKATQVVDAALDSGKKDGKIPAGKIEAEMSARSMDPSKWKVDYTKGIVDYNQPLEVSMEGTYRIKAFYALGNLFGEEMKKVSFIPIKVKRETNGQVYYR